MIYFGSRGPGNRVPWKFPPLILEPAYRWSGQPPLSVPDVDDPAFPQSPLSESFDQSVVIGMVVAKDVGGNGF